MHVYFDINKMISKIERIIDVKINIKCMYTLILIKLKELLMLKSISNACIL
jgi:hypothetical protein